MRKRVNTLASLCHTVGEPPLLGETWNDIREDNLFIRAVKRSKVYRAVGVKSDGMSMKGIWMNLGGLGIQDGDRKADI